MGQVSKRDPKLRCLQKILLEIGLAMLTISCTTWMPKNVLFSTSMLGRYNLGTQSTRYSFILELRRHLPILPASSGCN